VLAACAAVVPFAILFTGAKVPFGWILVASIAVFITVYKVANRSEAVNEIRRKKDDASNEWSRVQTEWLTRASSLSFDTKRSELERLKQEWDQLPDVRLRKLDELKARHQQLQMEEHLDRFEIESATIPHIGPGRKQTLSSYGIETAADIKEHEISKVPGIGPVSCSKLIEWRESVEAQFTFNPNRKIDPQHVAKVEQDILSERKRIEERLRAGSVELRTISGQILAARQHMKAQVEAAYGRYLQATADFDVAKS
jgi:DNA-binding helix-hairpin-helix protein with protein kinase domain